VTLRSQPGLHYEFKASQSNVIRSCLKKMRKKKKKLTKGGQTFPRVLGKVLLLLAKNLEYESPNIFQKHF
jgi:hypothetical protein